MVAADFAGRPLPPRTVAVERGPVANFAKAVKDDDPAYAEPAAAAALGLPAIPAPPTYSFAMAHWGSFPELQPDGAGSDNPVLGVLAALHRERPGLLLHGEQEFTYHRPILVGDVLTAEGCVRDVTTKARPDGSSMTFVVVETRWRDAAGEPVVTEAMTLIHRSSAGS